MSHSPRYVNASQVINHSRRLFTRALEYQHFVILYRKIPLTSNVILTVCQDTQEIKKFAGRHAPVPHHINAGNLYAQIPLQLALV